MTMSLSKKGVVNNITKLNAAHTSTSLNPNAAEFVPLAFRSPSGRTDTGEVAMKLQTSGTSGKAVLDRTESTLSDEEAHQYWRQQLPDDITPDFKFMGEDEIQGHGSLSFSKLSLLDGIETSVLSPSTGRERIFSKQQDVSSNGSGNNGLFERIKYSAKAYVKDQPSADFLNLPANPWDRQSVHTDHNSGIANEASPYDGNSSAGFHNYMFSEKSNLDGSEVDAVGYLATLFPGFAPESLAEVYYANGCDLNLTTEMLTQLELQVDGGFTQNLNTKTGSALNPNSVDLPVLLESDNDNGLSKYAGDDLQQILSPYRSMEKENILPSRSSSYGPHRGSIASASAVNRMPSQDSKWKNETNGYSNGTIGSSRNYPVLASTYHRGHGKPIYDDQLQNYGSATVPPVWLETGEAVANMYSQLRQEARDHAHLRNVYLEQAGQAYLIGNKALAKDLIAKGQLHSMHMKAAHEETEEPVYRQRNPISPEVGRGQERMIDLHGLQVSEAIYRLRSELNVWKSPARRDDQPLQLYIYVGTDHHTRGSRSPVRLLVEVEQYLLHVEGLEYTEPQPGLLRVLLY